jgi:hypothetical protein
LAIARVRNFFLHRNGVDVRRVQLDWDFNTGLARPLDQSLKQITPAMRPFHVYDLVECLKPFADFFFGINFPVQRKLEYSIINLVCGHRYLNNFENS